jgi:hypothetical protein
VVGDDGAGVAGLRPVEHGHFVLTARLKSAFARLPSGGFESLRADADAVFGEERVGG